MRLLIYMKEKIIPFLAMQKILEQAQAFRISKEAKKELNYILLEQGERIARKAIKYANHAKRITIKEEDIKLVLKKD